MIRAGIIKTSSVVGVAQNTQISLKRKVSDEQQYLSLEDNLKRFRITYTPGELRLGRDMKELNDLPDISLRTADDPSCVSVCFMVSRVNDVELPSQFLVKVPRYYPHHSPLVYCIQKEFACPIIDPHSHEVFHSQLQSGWSAIGTLRTVLSILEDVRMQYIYNEFKVKPPISESPASAHVLHRHKDTHCASVTPIFVGAENDIENGADFQMTEN